MASPKIVFRIIATTGLVSEFEVELLDFMNKAALCQRINWTTPE